jgi:protein-disulfide isomerase
LSSSRRPRSQQGPATRRERREAARRSARGAPRRQARGPSIAWLTAGVVIVAAAVIVFLGVVNRSPAAGPQSSPVGTGPQPSPVGTGPQPSPVGTGRQPSPVGTGRQPASIRVSSVTTPSVLTPTADASGRMIGPDSAPVKLDLWADFQCPVCEQFTDVVEPQIVSSYVTSGKAQLVFHDLAFIGPESTQAAVGGLCAADQAKFWPYHDYVYANQGVENSGALSDATLEAIAQAAGLDVATFTACLGNDTHLQEVQDELQQAGSLGLTGTPTLFVNGRQLPNALDYPAVAAAIDAALAAASR